MNNQRTPTRRPLLLILLAVVVLLAGTAQAGWFDKKPDKSTGLLKNHRFNRYPTLSFTRGELHKGMRGQWMLDKRKIQLTKGCVILGEDGSHGELTSGLPAIVSGTVIGDMVFATEVRLLTPIWRSPPAENSEGHKEASDSNSNVGILKDAPE